MNVTTAVPDRLELMTARVRSSHDRRSRSSSASRLLTSARFVGLKACFVALLLMPTLSPRAAGRKAVDPTPPANAPALGPYANLLGSICGRDKVEATPAAIPRIGCFAVAPGSSIEGEVEGRMVRIDIDAAGQQTFFVDTQALRRIGNATTNNPLVKSSASGFAFCSRDRADCPTIIDVLTTTPGGFAVFDVARELEPSAFVTNEENGDAESARHPAHDR